jgi:hypothetical protein
MAPNSFIAIEERIKICTSQIIRTILKTPKKNLKVMIKTLKNSY